MQARFRKYIALLLTGVFSLLILPKELLHELNAVHHTDTVDRSCNCDLLHFDVQHQHCDALQLVSPDLHHSIQSYTPLKSILEIRISFNAVSQDTKDFSHFYFLRGPPVA